MRTAKTNTARLGFCNKAVIFCFVLCFLSLIALAQEKRPKKHTSYSPQHTASGIHLVMRHDLGSCSYGYADSSGRWVIPPQYQDVKPFSTLGLAIVKKDEKYGMIDTANHVIIPFEYDIIEVGSNRWYDHHLQEKAGSGNLLTHYYKCRKNDLWGVIDMYGKLAVPPKYRDLLGYFADGSIIHQELNMAFVNRFGKESSPGPCVDMTMYNNLLLFTCYTARSHRDYPYHDNIYAGLADTAGHILLPPEYDNIVFYNDTLITADSGSTTTLFNAQGKLLFCLPGYKLHPITDWDSNLFYYVINYHGAKGMADSRFKMTIPVVYNNLTPLFDSATKKVVFLADLNYKFGIIDMQNKIIKPLKYEYFYNDQKYIKDTGTFVTANANYRQYSINVSTGKTRYIPRPKILKEYYSSGLYRVAIRGRFGMVNTKNDTVMPVKYTWLGTPPTTDLTHADNMAVPDLVYVEKGNRMVCINIRQHGKEYDINTGLQGKYHVFWGMGRYYNRSHGQWEWQWQSRIVDHHGKTIYKTNDYLEKVIFDKYVTKEFKTVYHGLFDFKGQRIWKGNYRALEEDTLSHQLFIMTIEKKCGVVDKDLKLIIDTVYNKISYYMQPGYYVLTIDSVAKKTREKYFLQATADINGYIILPFADQTCTHSTPWALVVMKHHPDKTGLVSFDGKTQLLPFDYDEVRFEEKYNLWLRKQNKWHLYLSRQNRLLPETYTRVQNFHNGMAKVWKHDSIALIDTIGNIISGFSLGKLCNRSISLANLYLTPDDTPKHDGPNKSDNINTVAEKASQGLKIRQVSLDYGTNTELIDSLEDDNEKRTINNFLLDTISAFLPEADGSRGIQFKGMLARRFIHKDDRSGYVASRKLPQEYYVIKIRYVSPYTLSLVYTGYSQGYSEPNGQSIKNYSISKAGLQPMNIKDLFISDSVLRQVSLLVWDSLKKSDLGDFDCKNPQLLISSWFDKYALRPDGITFYITKDEARYASYLSSAIYITIPYKALLPYLKPGSPAIKMAEIGF